uniref:Uncharacterized protein n=1 Tax=Anguilla anguilla TaxID=7936 RepID=A0A0E9TLK2_ANGAN
MGLRLLLQQQEVMCDA